MVWRLRAPARGGFYSFGQTALRSARARDRAGFFFELVCALVARGMFSLLVKWLCAPRGPERRAGFFFEQVRALVARGMFSLLVKWLCAPRWRRGAGFFFELVLALVARGMFSLLVKWLCAPRGPERRAFFSLSRFARWWRGGCFSFGQMALRSARARGREGCFESPLPTSGLHPPRNELRAARP